MPTGMHKALVSSSTTPKNKQTKNCLFRVHGSNKISVSACIVLNLWWIRNVQMEAMDTGFLLFNWKPTNPPETSQLPHPASSGSLLRMLEMAAALGSD